MDKPLPTVTLPILIAASDDWKAFGGPKIDGWYFPNHDDSIAVRVVRGREVEQRWQKIFSPKEAWLFVGAKRLNWAYNRKNELALRQAIGELKPWAPGPWNLKSGNQVNWTGVRFIYSGLISNLTKSARLVMWCSDKEEKFLPGVYCPDWKTAAFVMAVMEKIRVCPKCSIPFTPKSDNQDYCTPAHGVAYRTAHSRWNAKQRSKRKQGAR